MKPTRPTRSPASFSAPPVTFMAGDHALSILFVADGRWTVSVDGGPPSQTFRTQVEAWEAGVRAAAVQDRSPPGGPSSAGTAGPGPGARH